MATSKSSHSSYSQSGKADVGDAHRSRLLKLTYTQVLLAWVYLTNSYSQKVNNKLDRDVRSRIS